MMLDDIKDPAPTFQVNKEQYHFFMSIFSGFVAGLEKGGRYFIKVWEQEFTRVYPKEYSFILHKLKGYVEGLQKENAYYVKILAIPLPQ